MTTGTRLATVAQNAGMMFVPYNGKFQITVGLLLTIGNFQMTSDPVISNVEEDFASASTIINL